jgi:hypothetical protein
VALAANEWLPFMTWLRHGLAADTVRAILMQLGSERLSQPDIKWQRVALLCARIRLRRFAGSYPSP